MTRQITRTTTRDQRGMTLVELMVAMAIGLMVVAGLAVMYSNSSRAGRELDSASRQIENGRFAVELLAQELAVAGFYGDVPLSGAAYTAPGPCLTDLPALGWDNATSKRPLPIEGKSPTEMAALTCATNPSASSQALLVRRLEAAVTALGSIDESKAYAYIQTSQCNSDNASIAYVVSKQKADFTLRNLACNAPGEVRRYLSRLYYVARCNDCAGAGADTVPTLKRAEVSGNQVVVTPLATGIEHVALEYGFDMNGDGIPDVYRTGLSGVAGTEDNNWANVMTVRVYVLARTTETAAGHTDTKTYDLGLAGTLGPFKDGYKRKVFVTTAKLQNVAGAREI